jgi:predicted esterase
MKLKKTFLGNKNSKKCVIVFHGWGGNSIYFRLALKPLFKKYFFIFYDFSPDILTSHPEDLLENFRRLRQDAALLIKKLKKENYQEFYLFGTSIGAHIAMYLSNYIPEVRKVILNMIGSSCSEAVWYGMATRKIKKEMQERGITLEKLKELWQEIEPKNNIPKRRNIQYLIFISKKEKVIPFWLCQEFIEKLEKENAIIYINKYFGHTVSGFINALRLKKIKEFLEK